MRSAMNDIDTWHAALQYPVAIVLLTIALALAIRWWGSRNNTVTVDAMVTGLLALLVGLVGIKQLFWTLWGALVSKDLFGAAIQYQNHWLPVAFNAAISIVGLVLLGRLASLVFGSRAYAVTTVAALCVFVAGAVLVGRG